MKTKLEKATEQLFTIALEDVFFNLHTEFKTKGGDITPEQVIMLEYYKTQIEKLIVEQVKQNL